MATRTTKFRKVLRRIGFQGPYAYFKGSTLQKASPYFNTKKEAQKWLKEHNKRKRKGKK